MALVLTTVAANDLANAMTTSIDVGVTETGGKLVIETSADAEISLHRFNAPPSFGAAAAGVISLNGLPIDDTSATAGTAAQYSIFNRNNLKQLEGEVAVSGKDLDLSSLIVGGGDTVSLTAFTITVT